MMKIRKYKVGQQLYVSGSDILPETFAVIVEVANPTQDVNMDTDFPYRVVYCSQDEEDDWFSESGIEMWVANLKNLEGVDTNG